MKKLIFLCFVFFAIMLIIPANAADHTIQWQNHCPYPVWVDIKGGKITPDGLESCGCRDNICSPSTQCPNVGCGPNLNKCDNGDPIVDGGGFKMEAGSATTASTHTSTVAKGWQGNFWGRTGCTGSDDDLTCDIGTCRSNFDGKGKLQCGGVGVTPPATKCEIQFDGYMGQDFYDVSFVDGFNLPILIEPVKGSYKKIGRTDSQYDCTPTGSGTDLNSKILAEKPKLALKKGKDVIAVLSLCRYDFLNNNNVENPKYCCLPPYGEYKDRDKNGGLYCDPTTWPDDLNSAAFFKKYSPLEYSYADDDQASTFTCQNAGPNTLTSYQVTFCAGKEAQRITLPGDDTHTHVPVIAPTPLPTPVPTSAPLPAQTPVPTQSPVPQAPYNPEQSGDVNF